MPGGGNKETLTGLWLARLPDIASARAQNLRDIDVTGLLQTVNTLQPAYTKYWSSIEVRTHPRERAGGDACVCAGAARLKKAGLARITASRLGQDPSSGDSYDLTVVEIDSVSHRAVIKDLFVVEVRAHDATRLCLGAPALRGPLARTP